MPGSPQKRRRREVEEAGNESRAGFAQANVERLANARRAREEAEVEARVQSGDLRGEVLDKFWPMAELVVERALRGEEVNREQLSAAFKILEQRFGRPGQQAEDPGKDEPTVIVYESAALTPVVGT